MQLHLRSGHIAWCGVIMAISVILQISAGVIETSSFFLLAAASFLTGCIERKCGIKMAAGFSVGAVILGFILAPQKLYCFTYAGFCVYVLVAEYFRRKKELCQNSELKRNLTYDLRVQYIIKGILYHILLIVAVFISVKIGGFEFIFSNEFIEKIKTTPLYIIIIAGIIAVELLWLIFDKAYIFFQERYGIIVCGREN